MNAWIGTVLISARIPHAGSLKDRRQIVRSLTDRMKRHFNVSVADLGPDGRWEMFALAAVCAGSSHTETEARTEQLASFLERGEDDGDYEIVEMSQEVFAYGDIQDRKTE